MEKCQGIAQAKQVMPALIHDGSQGIPKNLYDRRVKPNKNEIHHY